MNQDQKKVICRYFVQIQMWKIEDLGGAISFLHSFDVKILTMKIIE